MRSFNFKVQCTIASTSLATFFPNVSANLYKHLISLPCCGDGPFVGHRMKATLRLLCKALNVLYVALNVCVTYASRLLAGLQELLAYVSRLLAGLGIVGICIQVTRRAVNCWYMHPGYSLGWKLLAYKSRLLAGLGTVGMSRYQRKFSLKIPNWIPYNYILYLAI